MKKMWIIPALMTLLLSGCGAEETFETVDDVYVQQAAAPVREIIVTLPEGAAAPAAESDAGAIYQCDGYEIMVQTMEGGDLNETIRTLSGFERTDLTVMYTGLADVEKYALVWACTGETGDRIGKAVILDDGSYHYTLTVLADANRTDAYAEVWQKLFESFRLS